MPVDILDLQVFPLESFCRSNPTCGRYGALKSGVTVAPTFVRPKTEFHFIQGSCGQITLRSVNVEPRLWRNSKSLRVGK